MNINRIFKLGSLLVFALLVGVSALVAQSENAQSANEQTGGLVFDIAEIPSRFSFDESKVFEDGMPAYGSAFITQGYIYPEGTLNGSNGVLEDGSPEFPDLVLGTWTCRGWMIGNGAYTEGEPWVISTQLYQFGDVEDGNFITTEGYEMPDLNVPFKRIISGGAGEFVGVEGEQVQQLLGFTDQMGVNLRVEFFPID